MIVLLTIAASLSLTNNSKEEQETAAIETETAAIETETAAIETETAAIETEHIEIKIDSSDFNKENIEFFKSSIFFNPRTEHYKMWISDFDDHSTIRLFSIFSWAVHESKDVNSFTQELQKKKEYLAFLTKTHDRFIVQIDITPSWLSSSDDLSMFDEQWSYSSYYSPGDYKKWNEIIKESVLFFNQFEDVEIYYEIWNEPEFYWQEGTDEFLKMYEETALTIKENDPDANIGGPATNQWNTKLDEDRESLIVELIRHASSNDIPLDFVSWHHFSINPERILEAKTTIENELKQSNFNPMPEFYVSEWNALESARNTPYASVIMAENFMGLYQAGIDIQTFCCLEDFHPDVEGFSGYGLITQKGEIKPTYYVHKMFDKIGNRESVFIDRNNGQTLIVAKEQSSNCYDVALWNMIPDIKNEAIRYVLSQISSDEISRDYVDINTLKKHIWEGSSIDNKRDQVFAIANLIHNEQYNRLSFENKVNELNKVNEMEIEFLGMNSIRADSTVFIKNDITKKSLIIENNKMIFDLENNEIFYTNACVE